MREKKINSATIEKQRKKNLFSGEKRNEVRDRVLQAENGKKWRIRVLF